MNTSSPGRPSNVGARGARRARTMHAVSALVSVVIGLLALPLTSSAHSLHALAQQPASNSVTIAPGGTATFTARGFCLDFGKPFPDQPMSTNGLADDKIRAALNYSMQKGYTEGSPDQIELAIWFLRDNTWHNAQHTIAQEIVTNATTANAPAPPAPADGTALSDAVAQNKVSITAKFVAQTAGHFYGDATIELKNSGTSQIQLFVPVGTVFTVPGSAGKYQDLAAYVLRVQSQAPTAQPTSTSQPTQQPTQQPAATQAPQATPTTDPSLMAQATPSPGTLPQTGGAAGEDAAGGLVPYLLVALGLMLCGGLLSYRLAKRNIR